MVMRVFRSYVPVDTSVLHRMEAQKQAKAEEVVTQELFDAVFAHVSAMPDWDKIGAEKQRWFRDRAKRLRQRVEQVERREVA